MSRLTTARAELRPWRHDEAERLFDIRSRPEVARWLGDPELWTEVATAHAKIDDWDLVTRTDDACGVWAIVPTATGVPVGTVILVRMPVPRDPRYADQVEIGWNLHPDATGQGWAREAAAEVLAHGVAAGVSPIWAIMWAHNEPSARVARAIGMTHLGVRDDPWYGTAEDPESRMFRHDADVTGHDEVWADEERAVDDGLLRVGDRDWTRDDLHRR